MSKHDVAIKGFLKIVEIAKVEFPDTWQTQPHIVVCRETLDVLIPENTIDVVATIRAPSAGVRRDVATGNIRMCGGVPSPRRPGTGRRYK